MPKVKDAWLIWPDPPPEKTTAEPLKTFTVDPQNGGSKTIQPEQSVTGTSEENTDATAG